MILKIPFHNPQFFFSDVINYIKHPFSPEEFRTALVNKWETTNIQVTKSARQAIWFILSALDLELGSEVLVSSFTAPVVPLAVMKAGYRPVFCDVVPNGFVMSPEDTIRKITSKSVAIIMPYSFGCYSDLEKFKNIAEKYQLILIEDCAQTIEGFYKNKRLGFNADFGIWSFGISKNIGSINGGAYWYHERHKAKIEKSLTRLSNRMGYHHQFFDITRAAIVPLIHTKIGYTITLPLLKLYEQQREQRRSYSLKTVEFDGNLTSLEATLCYYQLERYSSTRQRRKNNYDILKKKLEDLVHFPEYIPDFIPDYLYAPILVDSTTRNRLLTKFSFVHDINFSHLDRLDSLKMFSFEGENRKKIQNEYILLSIHHHEGVTREIAKLLRNYISGL